MIRRFCHQLGSNKACQVPTNFIFYDTETTWRTSSDGAQTHKLRLGVACFWRRRARRGQDTVSWHTFHRAVDFWDKVFAYVRRKTTVYCIAHNQAFDFPVLNGFRRLRENGWTYSNMFYNNPILILTFRKGKRKLVFLDNLNFFRMSLAEIGKAIGVKKGQVDFENVSDVYLEMYCHRDVEILLRQWQGYISFILKHDLGNFKPTISGQALSAFTHRFNRVPIYIHTNKKAVALERSAYYGGRTECFRIGKVKRNLVYCLDVDSLYPYVMSGNLFPVRLLSVRRGASLAQLKVWLRRYLVVADLDVKVNEPILPMRRDGKLVFPVGQFQGVWCTPEINLLLRRGKILRVHRVTLYYRGDIFTGFVNYLHQLKVSYDGKGDGLYRLVTKSILNHLYGKFGQLNEQWEVLDVGEERDFGYEIIYDFDAKRYRRFRWVNGVREESVDRQEGWNSFVAIAAHVTSYARVYLWKLITTAGRENVLYCDTDSLFVNSAGYRKLQRYIEPGVLGKLKVEWRAHGIEIFGCKDYKTDDKVVLKGIRKGAVEIEPNRYRVDVFPSLYTTLKSPIEGTIKVVQREKTLRRIYDKGVVRRTGRVDPLQLSLDG